ncbi:MAG: UDP-3-O-[3-hydroxymyristoyl] glucosamine N-acyltransferase, partial [Salibacteraceae bacterium]
MKFNPPQTLGNIASIIGAKSIGNSDFEILGLNEIHKVEPGDIVFVDHPKYYDKALNSAATIILINKEVEAPEGKVLLISKDPFRDTLRLIDHFSPFEKAEKAITDSAKIGEGSVIQPNVFIGNNVTIGKNCRIHSGVSIYDNSVIGNNVLIHSNTVLGADAFYYQKREGTYQQFTSCGRVVIKDNVHIGANCTIDKGVTGDTEIGEGSKLDNLIHVGHDTVIGKNCLFASQVGIAGCVTIEDNVTLWGQVGVASDLTIEEGAVVYAQSGVGK